MEDFSQSTTNAAPLDRGTTRALTLLSVAYFIQTTTALSVVGSLQSISAEWHLSSTAAALLVTAFGATFALSAPLLQVLIGHWVRHRQILLGLSVMAVGAFGFALAPNYPLLFGSRVIMGLGAALISPVLSALGSSLVKPEQQGGALAVVLMGLSVSAVIGVPASAWVAMHVGPRWLFLILGLLAVGTTGLIATTISDRSVGERVSPHELSRILHKPATFSALIVILLLTDGIFSTYTMITSILHERYGANDGMVTVALLTYGVSGLIGNLFVRRASQRWSSEALLKGSMMALIGIFGALLVLPVSMVLLLAALVAWPFILDIVWPSQQRRIIELEPDFRGIALALTGAFMLSGIALGSALGGFVYPLYGFGAVLGLTIGLIAVALGVLNYSVRAKLAETQTPETLRAALALEPSC